MFFPNIIQSGNGLKVGVSRAQKNGRADHRSDHKNCPPCRSDLPSRSPIFSMSFEQNWHLEIDTHGVKIYVYLFISSHPRRPIDVWHCWAHFFPNGILKFNIKLIKTNSNLRLRPFVYNLHSNTSLPIQSYSYLVIIFY